MIKKLMLLTVVCFLAAPTAAGECRTRPVKRVAVWAATLPIPLNTVWTWLYFTGEDLYCYTIEEDNQNHIINLNHEYLRSLGYVK